MRNFGGGDLGPRSRFFFHPRAGVLAELIVGKRTPGFQFVRVLPDYSVSIGLELDTEFVLAPRQPARYIMRFARVDSNLLEIL